MRSPALSVPEQSAAWIPATPLTRAAVRGIVLIILGTTGFLLVRYGSLPALLPVHFRCVVPPCSGVLDSVPNGWVFRTWPRVLMPVFVQLALAITLGSIAALLLARSRDAHVETSDTRAAAAAAEAVLLIASIWVAFQAYAAIALVGMWTSGRAALGPLYVALELAGLVLTGVVGVRAQARLGRPAPLPFVREHWRLGQLYCNAGHPALFVPTRDGTRWTLNFGRPAAVILLATILAAGIVLPTLILLLALRG